jgi:ABC-type transport system involved in cytochrome c biogenesis permease subunit
MTTALVPALQSNWLVMHVTVMMLSYGFISWLLAICYLIVAFFTSFKFSNGKYEREKIQN